MENREMTTTKKITQGLIGNWLLWGIVFGIIYSFVYGAITNSMKSLVPQAIIAIVLQGIMSLIMWKLSTKSVFKKKTMSYSDVPTVMRNLIIFTIIICVINGIYNFSKVNKSIDEAVNSDFGLQYMESRMKYLYSDSQIVQYNKEKEEAISKVKSQARTYLVIVEIGLTAVYLGVLPLEKKEILKCIS